MNMLEFPHDQPIDKDERKQAGLAAQAAYPKGYRPVREHPCLFCKASDRPRLKERLAKQPWRDWYEKLLRPLAEVALAARDLAELQTPLFHLKVFPLQGEEITPVQSMGPRGLWKSAVANCALVAFLEQDDRFLAKARQLLLESVDAVWGDDGGWGGEDYDLDSGWTFSWIWNAGMAVGYDLVASSFSPAERRRYEARLARDLEYCQTDPLSPRYNPSWVGVTFMGTAALLLGREDYVRKVEAYLDQWVDQVLNGEGEYFEGSSYNCCMEPQCIMLLTAIRNITGRNPAANPRWAMRAEHWIRRAAPLGTDVTHSDAGLAATTAQLLLPSIPLLPQEVAGWVTWLYNRIGDPGWLPLAASDDERRRGISRPSFVPGPGENPDTARRVPERARRYPYGVWPEPSFWLMTPDPLPKPVEPPAGSYVARNAGLACLRADWSMPSMHTCLFAPRFFGSPHSHWDSLTFDLWAHGAYLLKNVGYGELLNPTPNVPAHLAEFLGAKPQPIPLKPMAPWTAWHGWDERLTFRISPVMTNIPTVDGGGGNHMTSRADPMHFVVNTGWAQALRVHSGVASSFTRASTVGTEGRVMRLLVQVDPTASLPGYLVVVDDLLPEKLTGDELPGFNVRLEKLNRPANPDARCNWYLHPRGEHAGQGSRQTWTTCDFLSFPPKDVRLEVCLPPEGLQYELHPDGCHFAGGSFQPGHFLDVAWKGQRRFWAVLRPAAEGQTLPPADDLPRNLGLRIRGCDDLLLVRPIDWELLEVEGVHTNAAAILARQSGKDFYLAAAATFAALPGGVGFQSSEPVLLTARGDAGSVFCDRPHKQPTPMKPVELIVRDPRVKAGRRVTLDGRRTGVTKTGGFALVLLKPGQHDWRLE